MHLQAVASAFLIVFLCQHNALVSALVFGGKQAKPAANVRPAAKVRPALNGAGRSPSGLIPGLVDDVTTLLAGNQAYQGLTVASVAGFSSCAKTPGQSLSPGDAAIELQAGSDVLSDYQGQIKSQGQIDPALLQKAQEVISQNQAYSALSADDVIKMLHCIVRNGLYSNNADTAQQLKATSLLYSENANNLGATLLNGIPGQLGESLKHVGAAVNNVGGKLGAAANNLGGKLSAAANNVGAALNNGLGLNL